MKSVLIVENNPHFRKAFKDVLQRHLPDTPVEEASNEEETWQKIEERQPYIVFVDIRLSGKSGLELTQEIKRRYPQTIVSILTNYDLPEYRSAALRYGADHFLLKDSLTPHDIAILAKAILSEQSSLFRMAAIGYPDFTNSPAPMKAARTGFE